MRTLARDLVMTIMKTSIALILISGIFSGCTPKPVETVTVNKGTDSAAGDGTPAVNGGSTTNGGLNPSSCTNINCINPSVIGISLGGAEKWEPKLPGSAAGLSPERENLYNLSFRYINEIIPFFETDTRLKLRFSPKTQPVPPQNDEYCFGRVTGMAKDANPYTKLFFKVGLRDILCSGTYDPGLHTCSGGFSLSAIYASFQVGPVAVDAFSVLDLSSYPHIQQGQIVGATVEIYDVRSDSACLGGDTHYCPANRVVRSGSCWSMNMEIATDETFDFN